MATGSQKLDQIVDRLKGTADPKRRYEYVLWLAKKLEPLPEEFRNDAFKVKGCVSQVYVVGQLVDGRLHWQGDSDAAITKGLLALLIEGLESVSEAHLGGDAPFKNPTGDFTIGGALAFLTQHESYDIGQLGFLKKFHTNEPMSYN